MKKVDLIIDLQYGSTGKGLIAGYLAEKNGYDCVINANMPNAGHTYVNSEGRKWVHKVLPNGIVSPNLKYVMIGAGSVFSVEQLEKELADSADILEGVKVYVHPMAVPLQEIHKAPEAELVSKIGSTVQGSMAAMVHKMCRDTMDNVVARDVLGYGLQDAGYKVVTVDHWTAVLMESQKILAEGAQGYSLGINQQFYPFTTSRECTPTRFMSDMGLPHTWLNKVIGTCRTYPIRVAGPSGGCYADQTEITWDMLGQEPEKTTVTKKVRRVFTFSARQMRDAIFMCQPDEMFLNFCNYGDREMASSMAALLNEISLSIGTGGVVQYLGWGATRDDIEEVND